MFDKISTLVAGLLGGLAALISWYSLKRNERRSCLNSFLKFSKPCTTAKDPVEAQMNLQTPDKAMDKTTSYKSTQGPLSL